MGEKQQNGEGYVFTIFYFLSTQDYYGVTFPGTTATMPGRDGLANNPYSGKSNFMLKCSFFGVLFFYSLASLLIHVSCSTDWQITFLFILRPFSVQVRRPSLVGMTLRPQLPQPACLQPGCSRSPSRLHRQEHRDKARDRARVSKHRTRPSSIPLCPLVMDTLVRKRTNDV